MAKWTETNNTMKILLSVFEIESAYLFQSTSPKVGELEFMWEDVQVDICIGSWKYGIKG